MMRWTALFLALIWLTPAEAGLFRRKQTPAQRAISQQRRSTPKWGENAYRKSRKKAASRKAKASPLVTRPRSRP